MIYIISMGSNLGESEKIMRGALNALETSPQWTTTGKSSFYRTVPWGKKDQPDFFECCCSRKMGKHAGEVVATFAEDRASVRAYTEDTLGPQDT